MTDRKNKSHSQDEINKLKVAQVAKRLNVSKQTVTLWCRLNKFPNAEKIETPIGEYWLIPETDLHGVEIKMGRPKKKE